MRYLILIVALLSLLTDARADIQVVWIPVDGTEVDDPVYELKSDGDRLYGAAERGVVVSDDNGGTWRTTKFERGVSALTIHGDTIYVGLNRDAGMFRSDDRGESWKPINNGLRPFEDADGRIYYGWIKQILVTRSGSVITVMHGPIYIYPTTGAIPGRTSAGSGTCRWTAQPITTSFTIRPSCSSLTAICGRRWKIR